jgi:hypothetical protein
MLQLGELQGWHGGERGQGQTDGGQGSAACCWVSSARAVEPQSRQGRAECVCGREEGGASCEARLPPQNASGAAWGEIPLPPASDNIRQHTTAAQAVYWSVCCRMLEERTKCLRIPCAFFFTI